MRKLLNKWWPWSFPKTLFWGMTAFFLVMSLFLSENNVIRWIAVKFDIAHQEKIISDYRKSIEEVGRKRDMLNSNLDTLETFARENYYFHLEDEDVYVCR